ncbi:flagellin, partial [Solidesulfovibrio sp.]|uniref:flagellin n=1 Tax=Solidesulfovibrio sp. TaxID=2910990 RepID=UPI002B2028A5
NASAEDYYYVQIGTSTASALGVGIGAATGKAGRSISTQQQAQEALDALKTAIVSKDKIRANLGALQNRLSNTISNLQIQAENLQASESQISDVDVATEMTQFVRKQILTQSAVAMLSQANSLPRMAMNLIQG